MQICRNLDAQGIKSIHGNTMTVNSLRRILTNKAYIGVYAWGDHTIDGGMPRIIDDDLFQRVQDRLESNKRGGKGARRKNRPGGRHRRLLAVRSHLLRPVR